MRVYLIHDRQVDYQEVEANPQKWTDEEFIEFAENEGTDYSLEGFQKEWNTNELFSDYGEELDQHWIRII